MMMIEASEHQRISRKQQRMLLHPPPPAAIRTEILLRTCEKLLTMAMGMDKAYNLLKGAVGLILEAAVAEILIKLGLKL